MRILMHKRIDGSLDVCVVFAENIMVGLGHAAMHCHQDVGDRHY